MMSQVLKNWAGNYAYRAAALHRPTSLDELQDMVRQHVTLKALGSRHSFNEIADSPGGLVSLEHFDHVLDLDRARRTVTVGGGMRYGELCTDLHTAGYALPNLASLPHISVAGACATGTHGSGDWQGNLATAVSAMELVGASGEIISLSRERHGEEFNGTVIGLGALGIIISVTLDILPTFEMQQDVYRNLSLEQCAGNFDELTSGAYSVSLFTDWSKAAFSQVWIKRIVQDGDLFERPQYLFGAKLAAHPLHPIEALSAENCTEQMGVQGPWHERLPHFKLDFTPSSGEELQSEYILPRKHAQEAFRTVYSLRERISPVLQISEVRTIAADKLWMSPCFERDSVAIHFTWHKDWDAVRPVLPLIEEKLADFDARPHWGKLFTVPPSRIRSLYPRIGDFQALIQKYDPNGKFRNSYLDKYIFGAR